MARVLLVGPGDERTATLEEALRSRSNSVVVSTDLAHAALLQRMFRPDVVLVPRLMLEADRRMLVTTPPTPLVLFVDLMVGGQLTLVAEGVTRVLPAAPTPAQIEALLASPLSTERPVGRLVGQLAQSAATGTVALREPDSGAHIADLVVQAGKVTETRRGPDLRTLVAREAPVAVLFQAGIADAPAAEDNFALGLDQDDDDTPVTAVPDAVRSAGAARLGPVQVLLADDDRDMLRFQATLLRAHGYDVVTAVDGDEALHTAATMLPDVIVADARMAGTSGWDLLALVRTRVRLRETPVVLTGYDGAWIKRLHNAGCGAELILEKGLRPERLVAAIDKVVQPTREVATVLQVARDFSPIDGRLKGSGPHTLLRLLAAQRFSGRVTVIAGDARFLVVLADGGLVFARVTSGGRTQMHRDALAALLQVGAVGFSLVYEATTGHAKGPLDDVVGEAASALDTVADAAYGDALADGLQLVVRGDLLAAYRASCSLEARPIVDQIASGRDARDLLTRGVDPMLLDRVVHDLFRKGAVRAW